MKLFPLVSAILLSAAPALPFAAPVKSEDNDIREAYLQGLYYGVIYGAGNTLCGLVVDKKQKNNMPKSYCQQ